MKQSMKSNFKITEFWDRLPVMIRAILSGFLVSSIGIAIWTADIIFVPLPIAILVMIVPLWAYCKYFSGSFGTKITMENRASKFRLVKLPKPVWKWGLAGALLFVVIIQSSFVITFRIVEIPAGYTSGYSMIEALPHWLAWSVIVMASVVAGICEETGFRGYMQVPLEKRYGPVIGIFVVSAIFVLIHLSKVWAAPVIPNIFFASVLLGILAYRTGSLIPGIIGHTILDIFDYSFWWTDLMGKVKNQTIFKTGIDLPFIGWSLLFITAVAGFFWAIFKLKRARPLSKK